MLFVVTLCSNNIVRYDNYRYKENYINVGQIFAVSNDEAFDGQKEILRSIFAKPSFNVTLPHYRIARCKLETIVTEDYLEQYIKKIIYKFQDTTNNHLGNYFTGNNIIAHIIVGQLPTCYCIWDYILYNHQVKYIYESSILLNLQDNIEVDMYEQMLYFNKEHLFLQKYAK